MSSQSNDKGGTKPPAAAAGSHLWNPDLDPVGPKGRTWDWKAYAGLWISMVVCVPTYLLGGSLVAQGMAWWQAVLTVLLGNVIVLIPMLLIGHAGAKYGIPFPVLLRSAFGTIGARLPAMARALVACGWFGINTWIGGHAAYVILNQLTGGALAGPPLPLLDINLAQFGCFLAFWAIHLYFIRHGTESIKWLEMLAAPFLILMSLLLLFWAWSRVGGFGPMLGAESAFGPGGAREGEFWAVFVPSLTAVVGFWATMAINIADFTRFARSQKDQMVGQAIGLPLPMALISFVGIAVTGATVMIFGRAIADPVELAGQMEGWAVILALLFLLVATITVNMGANIVGPAYDFSNLAPRRISFETGGYITAAIGIVIFPWKLLETAGSYLFTWLVGYSALLGPIGGILIADYYLLKRRQLDVDALFDPNGPYSSRGGWNPAGHIAFLVGVLPSVPGFLHATGLVAQVPEIFDTLYSYAWFVGFAVGAGVYLLLAKRTKVAQN
ncbi:MAG: NCS1 family nucleobase:cation symporter-1 [Sphingosinicella sp.]